MKVFLIICGLLCVLSCTKEDPITTESITDNKEDKPAAMKPKSAAPLSLKTVLAIQDENNKLRYPYRHPEETIRFFGIKPGATVIEALPGGGWYTKILSPFLGQKGKLIGVDYDIAMWPHFSFTTDEFVENRKVWAEQWPQEAQQWSGEEGAKVSAYTFASLPAELNDSIDAVLFIRALHNLSRFENKGQYLSKALKETLRVLKPGGIVGVVQHRADEAASDEWADGSRGYLKESRLIKRFEDAGFALVDKIEVNANPKDIPSKDDIVWRLPPNYATAKAAGANKAEVKAAMDAIGESDRMTLLFSKPLKSL